MGITAFLSLRESPATARRLKSIGLAMLCAAMLGAGVSPSRAQSADDLRQWGEQALDAMRTDYLIPRRGLYADSWKAGQTKPGDPAFTWGCGVVLPALVAAAQIDPTKYRKPMEQYVRALDVYLTDGPNGIPGYDVLPGPKPFDRYYDDNMWVDMALVDVYDITGSRPYLNRAEAIFKFIDSGEDSELGGGIYWKEKEKSSKNTCSNGPAIVCALRLFQASQKRVYLDTAKRLYAWTNAHLQDTDGLYFDNIKIDGKVEKTKWSYNTALMLRANCLLYQITSDATYLTEAKRIGKAAESYWVKPDTGAIADGGQFAHLLCEAFFALGQADRDPHWKQLVVHALGYVHDHVRDSNGRYGDTWNRPVTAPLQKVGILSQASVARAFLFASHAM